MRGPHLNNFSQDVRIDGDAIGPLRRFRRRLLGSKLATDLRSVIGVNPAPARAEATWMRALVYERPGKLVVQRRPVPQLVAATDAIVKVERISICATDLEIARGERTDVRPGRILGHEGVGIISAVGADVHKFRIGDRVIISCITTCGTCGHCLEQMAGHCRSGGWILGNEIDGTQAEYVRIPYANTSLHAAPASLSADACVMLSDVMPTAYECGALNAKIDERSTIAIIGAGWPGLSALQTAKLFSPKSITVVDVNEEALAKARSLGATRTVYTSNLHSVETVQRIRANSRINCVIETLGTESAFALSEHVVDSGGTIANIAGHGIRHDLDLARLWSRNVRVTMGSVNAYSQDDVIGAAERGDMQIDALIGGRYAFADITQAYQDFETQAMDRGLKVVVDMTGGRSEASLHADKTLGGVHVVSNKTAAEAART